MLHWSQISHGASYWIYFTRAVFSSFARSFDYSPIFDTGTSFSGPIVVSRIIADRKWLPKVRLRLGNDIRRCKAHTPPGDNCVRARDHSRTSTLRFVSIVVLMGENSLIYFVLWVCEHVVTDVHSRLLSPEIKRTELFNIRYVYPVYSIENAYIFKKTLKWVSDTVTSEKQLEQMKEQKPSEKSKEFQLQSCLKKYFILEGPAHLCGNRHVAHHPRRFTARPKTLDFWKTLPRR